jgi:hypothetical protein
MIVQPEEEKHHANFAFSMQHFYCRSLDAEWALKVLGLERKAGGEEPTAEG